ncbi:hypothetical protein SSX86_024752 [Deinandra increscens subsp. villosa]|uniref:Integrase catalytic domain-containing protein n=1 Tax=Deinandra increscens subsp. villosa TaxID=3103831 RepID=A0AAP0CHY4_9ASTR
MAGKLKPIDDWVVDSEAMEHITYRTDLLENKKKSLYEAPVIIPNGETVPIDGKGDYVLQGGNKIKEVIFVPKFKCNLLSVRRLTKDLQGSVTFYPDFCVIQGLRSRNLIGAGECKKGLYRMGIFGNGRKALATTVETVETWHKRLGHASKSKLIQVDFLKDFSFENMNNVCDPCAKAKHTRQPFPLVKRVRCDNGGEFTSKSMTDFYAKQGILLETTCPHTPQQNGVVERKHRHLLEMARALRFEANLPKRFWGECILTAAYVINRLPSKVLKHKTPYELLFNQKPDYDHMKVFGCLVYYKSNETKGDKFELRGRPGVFLGYPPGSKGYKIFDLENRKIVVSRDTKFHENNFPFLVVNQSEKEPDPLEHPIGPAHFDEPNNIDYSTPCTNQNVRSVDDNMVNEEPSETLEEVVGYGTDVQNEESEEILIDQEEAVETRAKRSH